MLQDINDQVIFGLQTLDLSIDQKLKVQQLLNL
jgi:hypothetical protein